MIFCCYFLLDLLFVGWFCFQKNTKVEILQLEDNLITPLGVTFLADMLCDNIYITHIVSQQDLDLFSLPGLPVQ